MSEPTPTNMTETIVLLFALFILGMILIPIGNTITSGDIERTTMYCKSKGGVDRYDTLFKNKAYCNNGEKIVIASLKYRGEE